MRVGIVVFEGADAMDVVGPLRVFGGAGDLRDFVDGAPEIELELVASGLDPVELTHRLRIEPTTTFTACAPLDVLVVPGGSSMRTDVGRRAAQRDEATLAFIAERAASATVTASVCTGAFLLASAGLLANRRANTHRRSREELVELMAERGEPFTLVTDRVVWDEPIVTAGGVTSGIDLALAIVERTFGDKVRRAVERSLEISTPG